MFHFVLTCRHRHQRQFRHFLRILEQHLGTRKHTGRNQYQKTPGPGFDMGLLTGARSHFCFCSRKVWRAVKSAMPFNLDCPPVFREGLIYSLICHCEHSEAISSLGKSITYRLRSLFRAERGIPWFASASPRNRFAPRKDSGNGN